MNETLISDTASLSWAIFNAAIVTSLLIERLWPKRQLMAPLTTRWLNNILLALFTSQLRHWLIPITLVAAAIFAEKNSLGLLNQLQLPLWLCFIISLLIYDFTTYIVHVAYHHFPILWCLHRVHHADPDVDFSTHGRHHPIESILNTGFYIGIIVALGLSPIAIVIYRLTSVFTVVFSHTNVKLPTSVEKLMRHVMITPDFHRIHHSSDTAETNSNYATVLTCWDYLFRTYTDKPKGGQQHFQTGLTEFRVGKELYFHHLLLQPFKPKSIE